MRSNMAKKTKTLKEEPRTVVIDKTTIEIIALVAKFFNNDYDKVALWMRLDNLNFGGCSPNTLINRQRGHKVLEFVRDAIGEGIEAVIKGESLGRNEES
jgi:hypothetical protein